MSFHFHCRSRAGRLCAGIRAATPAAAVAAIAVAVSGPAFADGGDDSPRLEEVERAVGELVEIQEREAELRASWREQKRQLESTRELQRAQIRELERTLADERARAERAEERRAELADRIEAMRAAQDDTRAVVQELGPAIADTYEALPPVARAAVREHARRARRAFANGDTEVAGAIQALTGLYEALARALAGVHTGREVIEVAGAEREVDVLYLGGAVGYFVTFDGDAAGLRVSTGSGWRTEPLAGIASDVRAAIEIARDAAAPRPVALPVPGGER